MRFSLCLDVWNARRRFRMSDVRKRASAYNLLAAGKRHFSYLALFAGPNPAAVIHLFHPPLDFAVTPDLEL
jgi:hypothetical protein